MQDQNKAMHTNTNKRADRGEFFLKINNRTNKDKTIQAGGIFFSNLINVQAHLFGTLEELRSYCPNIYTVAYIEGQDGVSIVSSATR